MTDSAYQAMAENVVEAFKEPRRSARRILALDLSFADCTMMAVLGFALQGLLGNVVGLVVGGAPDLASSRGIGGLIAQLALQLGVLMILSGGIYAVGKRFGGRASRSDATAMAAWHILVTALLSPLIVIGVGAVAPGSPLPGLLVFLWPLAMGVTIWLFASFVAEAHGFERLMPVVFASIGGMFALGIVSAIFFSLFLGPPA